MKMRVLILCLFTIIIGTSADAARGQAKTGLQEDSEATPQTLSEMIARATALESRIEGMKTKLKSGQYEEADGQKLEAQCQELMVELSALQRQIKQERTRLEAQEKAQDPEETRLFKLEHVDCRSAQVAVMALHRGRGPKIATVLDSNTLIARGSRVELDEIASLIEQLEAQGPPPVERAREVRSVLLQQRDIEPVTALLQAMFTEIPLWPDAGSNRVFFWATQQEFDSVAAVIKELDQPGQVLAVTIDFIQAAAGSKDPGALPQYLEGVGSAIREAGMGNLRLLAHSLSRVQDTGEFEGAGFVKRVLGDESYEEMSISLNGQASPVPGGSSAQISIQANIERQVARGRPHGAFHAETSAVIPLGDYVVLGAMPSQLEDTDTIVMVIRVTAD